VVKQLTLTSIKRLNLDDETTDKSVISHPTKTPSAKR